MKKVILAGATVFFAACGSGPSRHPSADSATTAKSADSLVFNGKEITSGYFVKNTLHQKDSVACWVFTSKQECDSVFGFGKVMEVQDTVDFSKEIMVAVTTPVSYERKAIHLLSFRHLPENSGSHPSELALNVSITNGAQKETYTSTGAWVFKISRSPDLQKISFYKDGAFLASVPVK